MVRKPTIPTLLVPLAAAPDKGLAVRDGLREVRFTVRHGAKKLIEAVEAATHGDETSPGPLGPLGRPLNLAVRGAATLLSTVDHAAVDLLAPDSSHRAMAVALRSSASHFDAGTPPDLHAFTTDHHWRLRHWLALIGRDDVFVHEQAIALAGSEIAAADKSEPVAGWDDEAARGEHHWQTCAAVARALAGREVLSKVARLPGEAEPDEDELPRLQARGAVVCVLAGEIAAELPAVGSERDRYTSALSLAEEIALADTAGWEAAVRPPVPAAALGRWFAFVARHV